MTHAEHRRVACDTSFHSGRDNRGPARSLLGLLLATSALTMVLHGVAFADGGAGGGLGGGAGGTGYTGANGSDAAQSGMYVHGGGGGGAAGGGAGGTGGPGVSGHGTGGTGGTGGLNNQNGDSAGDGSDGAIGGVSGMASGGGSGGGGGMGGAGFYYTSSQDLDLDTAPASIVGGKGGAGGKGYPQGGAGGKGGDGGGGVVMETGDSVIVSVAGVTGGDGGTGGDGANAGDLGAAGRGGMGGAAVVVSGGGNVTVYPTPPFPVPVLIIGGKGGDGGNGNSGSQARGGDGGVGGAAIEAAGGGDILIENGGLEGGEGGAGGNGGSGAEAGVGGAGGVAIDATSAKSVTIGASSAVVGGYGGAGGTGAAAGVGGVGIVASGGITVTVAGSVSGGVSGDTVPVRADAIDLFGGGNLVEVQAGYSLTGKVVSNGAGVGDTLTLGGDTSASFNLADLGVEFQGFSALGKNGASTWTLTGSSSFSGPTTVYNGTLALDTASLADSAVTVGWFGTLSATGSVSVKSLDVAGMSGTLTLGTATTTLTAASGATFESGSTFNVSVDDSGNASKIDAGSSVAVLLGGDVMVTAAPGAYSASTQYLIVSGQSVSGTFAGADMAGPSLLTPTLHYDIDTEVYLTFATDFGTAADTHNQRQVASALDTWGLGGPLSAYLLDLDPADAPAAYDALSGDAYASAQTAMLDDSHIVRDAMEDRLQMTAGAGKNLWGKVFGDWGSHDGNGNAAGFTGQTTGVLFGADAMLGDWRVGALMGYGRTAFNVPDRGASAGIDGYHAGLYAGSSAGDLEFRAGAGFTRQQIAMARGVSFGDLDESLTGDYGADTGQGFAELGYKLKMGGTEIEPFGNLANVALHTDGFTEKGGDAALTVGSADADVTLTTLGIHTSTAFSFGTIAATANATIGWQHAFGGTPHNSMAFAGGDAFDVAGVPLAADAAVLKADMSLALSPAATLKVIYGGQFATGAIDQSANADFNLQF